MTYRELKAALETFENHQLDQQAIVEFKLEEEARYSDLIYITVNDFRCPEDDSDDVYMVEGV